jgi:biotin carboxyl carrier protein
MSEWKVKVNQDAEYGIQQEKDEILLDGKSLDIDLLELGNGRFHLIHEGRSFNASLVKLDPQEKKLCIKINNRKYDLEVEDQYDQLLQKLGLDNLASAAISQLKAPMPGLVLDILVEEGQTVSKDDSILILEAMKMENVLKSPADLTIKKISVETKQSVEKNQLLIEFE